MKTMSAELAPRHLLLVQRACQLMTRDFSTDLSLPQICQSVGASRSKLSRLFRQYCGCGAMSWLREQKMQQACRLLEHSDLSVCEIAIELGFYDSAFFCKTFKTKFGITPLKFRQNKIKTKIQ
jgi:AraC-like DNA-binding protein